MKAILIILFLMLSELSWAASETNENIPVDGIETTYISGPGFKNRKVTYSIKDNLAVFEGDIILGTVDEAESWREKYEYQKTENDLTSIVIKNSRFRWKNGILVYSIASNVSDNTKKLIKRAISHWESKTNVRFVERNRNNSSKYTDYVEVVSDQQACWSWVGRRGGKQKLNVVEGCGFGSIVHEFGHALGLFHEQSRHDRNKYIKVHYENIIDSRKHNFEIAKDGNDVGNYDYGSIMHYGRKYFSKNGKDTITPLKKGVIIGQRKALSKGDIASINKIYPFKKAHLISPRNGQQLTSTTLNIRWSKNSAYKVRLALRGNGVFKNYWTTGTSQTVTELPSNGGTIYIYLFSYDRNGHYKGYERIYVKAPKGSAFKKALFTYPSNYVKVSDTQTFRWNMYSAKKVLLLVYSYELKKVLAYKYFYSNRATISGFSYFNGKMAVILYSYENKNDQIRNYKGYDVRIVYTSKTKNNNLNSLGDIVIKDESKNELYNKENISKDTINQLVSEVIE